MNDMSSNLYSLIKGKLNFFLKKKLTCKISSMIIQI